MEKDARKLALQRFIMSPEEMENYSNLPMDEYTRTNDPELYNKIEQAKRINEVIDMSSGMGGPMGTIGMLGKFKPVRVPYVKGKYKQADIQKVFSKQDLNPEKENLGKVIEKLESPEQMGTVKSSTEGNPLTLEERVNEATQKETALFKRLLELTGKKPK